MKPILRLRLPALSAQLEADLLSQVHDLETTSIGVTVTAIEQRAKQENDVSTLEQIDSLKRLYNFAFLPKHLKKVVSHELEQQVRNELMITLPADIDFEIQAVTADSFPCDSFVHHDGHKPGSRRVGWYYLLSNSTARTSFYTSDRSPVYGLVWSPSDVTETAAETMQQHNWYSFNHNHIHGVKGITAPRHALVINFSSAFDSYESCMENFRDLISK